MTGYVKCIVQSDCANLEIKFLQVQAKNDNSERVEVLTRTDSEGYFGFEGVPKSMNMHVYVEKLHFCWVRQMLHVQLDK